MVVFNIVYTRHGMLKFGHNTEYCAKIANFLQIYVKQYCFL